MRRNCRSKQRSDSLVVNDNHSSESGEVLCGCCTHCLAQADDLRVRSGGALPLPGWLASPWKPETNIAPYSPFNTGSSPGVSWPRPHLGSRKMLTFGDLSMTCVALKMGAAAAYKAAADRTRTRRCAHGQSQRWSRPEPPSRSLTLSPKTESGSTRPLTTKPMETQ